MTTGGCQGHGGYWRWHHPASNAWHCDLRVVQPVTWIGVTAWQPKKHNAKTRFNLNGEKKSLDWRNNYRFVTALLLPPDARRRRHREWPGLIRGGAGRHDVRRRRQRVGSVGPVKKLCTSGASWNVGAEKRGSAKVCTRVPRELSSPGPVLACNVPLLPWTNFSTGPLRDAGLLLQKRRETPRITQWNRLKWEMRVSRFCWKFWLFQLPQRAKHPPPPPIPLSVAGLKALWAGRQPLTAGC